MVSSGRRLSPEATAAFTALAWGKVGPLRGRWRKRDEVGANSESAAPVSNANDED